MNAKTKETAKLTKFAFMETSKDLKDLNKSPEEETTLNMARTQS